MITIINISGLAAGSALVECETRAAEVAIGKFVRCFLDKNNEA